MNEPLFHEEISHKILFSFFVLPVVRGDEHCHIVSKIDQKKECYFF